MAKKFTLEEILEEIRANLGEEAFAEIMEQEAATRRVVINPDGTQRPGLGPNPFRREVERLQQQPRTFNPGGSDNRNQLSPITTSLAQRASERAASAAPAPAASASIGQRAAGGATLISPDNRPMMQRLGGEIRNPKNPMNTGPQTSTGSLSNEPDATDAGRSGATSFASRRTPDVVPDSMKNNRTPQQQTRPANRAISLTPSSEPIKAPKGEGAVGKQLADFGVSREQRRNQTFVDKTLGAGKFTAGTYASNMELRKKLSQQAGDRQGSDEPVGTAAKTTQQQQQPAQQQQQPAAAETQPSAQQQAQQQAVARAATPRSDSGGESDGSTAARADQLSRGRTPQTNVNEGSYLSLEHKIRKIING